MPFGSLNIWFTSSWLLTTISISPVRTAPSAFFNGTPLSNRSPSPSSGFKLTPIMAFNQLGATPTPFDAVFGECYDPTGRLPPLCTGLIHLLPYSATYAGGKIATPVTPTPPPLAAALDQCYNPASRLPPLCTGLIHLLPYSATYTGGRFSSTIATPSPTPLMPICYNYADPDNAIPDQCVCSQGQSITTVSPLKTGNPCPWTTLPITGAGPAPVWTIPPQTNDDQDFSLTTGYNIYACRSSIVSRYDNVDVTSCEGTSSLVGYIPHASMQLGKSIVNVGTLTSDALYSAVSSALESACPTPSPGGSAGCNGAATLTGVYYTYNTTSQYQYYKRAIETGSPKLQPAMMVPADFPSIEKRIIRDIYQALPKAEKRVANRASTETQLDIWASDIIMRDTPHIGPTKELTIIETDGELVIQALDSNYTSTAIRDSMITLVSKVLSSSASGNACKTVPNWQINNKARRDLDPSGSSILCGSTEFVQIEYMNEEIYANNEAAWLGVQLVFRQGLTELLQELFDCEAFVNLAFALAPELEELDITAEDLVDMACLDSAEREASTS